MIGGLLAGMALLILIALLLLFEFRVLGIIDYTKKKFKWENNKVVWIIVISFFGFLGATMMYLLFVAVVDGGNSLAGMVFFVLLMILSVVAIILFFVFWVLMIVDCAKRNFKGENDKVVWILVIVLLGFIGATMYYFAVKASDKKETKKK